MTDTADPFAQYEVKPETTDPFAKYEVKPQTAQDQVKGMVNTAKGYGETALHEISGGLSSIPAVVNAALPGQLSGTTGNAAERYQQTKENLTYEPRTEAGKQSTQAFEQHPITQAVGGAMDLPGKAVEAVGKNIPGVSEETSKFAHQLTSDFLPFALPSVPEVRAGAKAAVSKGLELGDRAVDKILQKENIPGAVKSGSKLEAFKQGISDAHANTREIDAKLTKGQLQAAGLRKAGEHARANKVMEREQTLSETHPEIADHYTAQRKEFQDKFLNLRTQVGQRAVKAGENFQLEKTADQAVIDDILKTVVVRDKNNVITSIDANRLADINAVMKGEILQEQAAERFGLQYAKALPNTSTDIKTAVDLSLKQAEAMSLSPIEGPKTSIEQARSFLYHHPGGIASIGAFLLNHPVVSGIFATLEGGKFVRDWLKAGQFDKVDKLLKDLPESERDKVAKEFAAATSKKEIADALQNQQNMAASQKKAAEEKQQAADDKADREKQTGQPISAKWAATQAEQKADFPRTTIKRKRAEQPEQPTTTVKGKQGQVTTKILQGDKMEGGAIDTTKQKTPGQQQQGKVLGYDAKTIIAKAQAEIDYIKKKQEITPWDRQRIQQLETLKQHTVADVKVQDERARAKAKIAPPVQKTQREITVQSWKDKLQDLKKTPDRQQSVGQKMLKKRLEELIAKWEPKK